MSIGIDKKAAKFGRWGLGIPRNIRKGTAKYQELKRRAYRRQNQLRARWLGAPSHISQLVDDLALRTNVDYMQAHSNLKRITNYARTLIHQYKSQPPIFKRPWIAAQLRKQLAQWKEQRGHRDQAHKNFTILRDLYNTKSPQSVVQNARKHGYRIYADVIPLLYDPRTRPATVRKKIQLQRKGHKINFNPSDFGKNVSFHKYMGGKPWDETSFYNNPLKNALLKQRNAEQDRILRKPEQSNTNGQQVRPTPIRDKYDHLRQNQEQRAIAHLLGLMGVKL